MQPKFLEFLSLGLNNSDIFHPILNFHFLTICADVVGSKCDVCLAV